LILPILQKPTEIASAGFLYFGRLYEASPTVYFFMDVAVHSPMVTSTLTTVFSRQTPSRTL